MGKQQGGKHNSNCLVAPFWGSEYDANSDNGKAFEPLETSSFVKGLFFLFCQPYQSPK
jgi:hypothetical protein